MLQSSQTDGAFLQRVRGFAADPRPVERWRLSERSDPAGVSLER
jgi:hypothetical protein